MNGPRRRRAGAACLTAFLAGIVPAVGAGSSGDGSPSSAARLTLLLGAAPPAGAPGSGAPSVLRESADPEGDRGSGGSTVRVVASSAALVAGLGLAIFLKREADDRYDRYLVTADPREANGFFESAERYDRASLLGWGMAQAGFILLFYSLIKESERPLIPVSGEASFRSGGVRIGFRVTP